MPSAASIRMTLPAPPVIADRMRKPRTLSWRSLTPVTNPGISAALVSERAVNTGTKLQHRLLEGRRHLQRLFTVLAACDQEDPRRGVLGQR
jgi:hypothetical protein